MTTNFQRVKRTRTLAVSVGVALGMTLSTLGPHLAQAATLLPRIPILDQADPPVDTDAEALAAPAA